MPRADHADLRSGAVKRIEESVDLRAGQAEDGIDAMIEESLDEPLATRHRRHGSSSTSDAASAGLEPAEFESPGGCRRKLRSSMRTSAAPVSCAAAK